MGSKEVKITILPLGQFSNQLQTKLFTYQESCIIGERIQNQLRTILTAKITQPKAAIKRYKVSWMNNISVVVIKQQPNSKQK